MNLPIKGRTTDVIGTLEMLISDLIEEPDIDMFYIGRTNDIINSKYRHGCDEIFPLYETSSANNAMDIEDYLIKIFLNHHKCDNGNDHSGGGVSDEYVNYVYIAVWYI